MMHKQNYIHDNRQSIFHRLFYKKCFKIDRDIYWCCASFSYSFIRNINCSIIHSRCNSSDSQWITFIMNYTDWRKRGRKTNFTLFTTSRHTPKHNQRQSLTIFNFITMGYKEVHNCLRFVVSYVSHHIHSKMRHVEKGKPWRNCLVYSYYSLCTVSTEEYMEGQGKTGIDAFASNQIKSWEHQ